MTLPARPTSNALATRLLTAIGAVVGVAMLTLAPRRYVAPARSAFIEIASPLFADWSYTEVESLLNAMLFVPPGVALAVLLGRRWMLSLPIGLMLSMTVEVLQSRIPGRVPDLDDVLWNTVGALGGAIAVALVRVIVRTARRPRRR